MSTPVRALLRLYLYNNKTASSERKSFLTHIAVFASQFEYVIYPFRKYLFSPTIVIVLVIQSLQTEFTHQNILLLGSTFFLQYWSTLNKKFTDLKIVELANIFPEIHPSDFYNTFKIELAFGTIIPYNKRFLRQNNHADLNYCKNTRAKQKAWLLVKVLFDTAYLANICLTAFQHLGATPTKIIFDNMAVIWGKRCLEVFENRFVIKNYEKLNLHEGKFIFVFNHRSSLDFMLAFLALSKTLINKRQAHVRFIVAKDHFKNNPIIYHLLGMGKIIEAMGMVFIERKNSKEGHKNLKEAAEFLARQDIDLALYPQGTRAKITYDRAGKRRDAGYYTTIGKTNFTMPLAHLKKGLSHLIIETLNEIKKQNLQVPLNIVFIGVKGTGTTLPINEVKIQTENEIEFVIGDIVSLTPSLLDDFFPTHLTENEKESQYKDLVQKLMQMTHHGLKEALGINQTILHKYLSDLKGHFRFEEKRIDQIAKNIELFSEDNDAIFATLDIIYSLSPKSWNSHLASLNQALQFNTTAEKILQILQEASEELITTKK